MVDSTLRVVRLPPLRSPSYGIHLAQVPFDGARAEEEPRADLRVRRSVTGEPRDLPLLRSQLIARLMASLPHALARGQKLLTCSLGDCLHADRRELVVGGAELLSRVDRSRGTRRPPARFARDFENRLQAPVASF
jgi:hypothetical protein